MNIQPETESTWKSISNTCHLEKTLWAKSINRMLDAPIPWVQQREAVYFHAGCSSLRTQKPQGKHNLD